MSVSVGVAYHLRYGVIKTVQTAGVDMVLLLAPDWLHSVPIRYIPTKSSPAQSLTQPSPTSYHMLSPWPLNFTDKHAGYFYSGHTIPIPQQLFPILWPTLTSGVKALNRPTTKTLLL